VVPLSAGAGAITVDNDNYETDMEGSIDNVDNDRHVISESNDSSTCSGGSFQTSSSNNQKRKKKNKENAQNKKLASETTNILAASNSPIFQ
jgi:hypothetical protein